MSIFTDVHVSIGGKNYTYTKRMHGSVNNYARELYRMMGYIDRDNTDFAHSTHPTERLMYSMALSAYIKFGRIKES